MVTFVFYCAGWMDWSRSDKRLLLDLWIQHGAHTNMQLGVMGPDSRGHHPCKWAGDTYGDQKRGCLQKLAKPLTHCMNWVEAVWACQIHRS